MTTTQALSPYVEVALRQKTDEARAAIVSLTLLVDSLANDDRPHWGHVGDMGHIVEKLNELVSPSTRA